MNDESNLSKVRGLFFEYSINSFIDFKAEINDSIVNQLITERRDVFNMYSTLFALNRTKRPFPDKKETVKERTIDCLFDDFSRVAKPLVEFPGWDVYSVPNPFAFNTGDHEVVFVKDHIEFIEDIRENHIKSLLFALANRAEFIISHENTNSLSCGINFGTDKMKFSAGASQPHLHAQIGAIYKVGFLPDADNLYKHIRNLSIDPIDFVEEYLNVLKEKNLLLTESDYLFSYCPFAPRFKDEVHLITKVPMKVRNYHGDILESLSHVLYEVIRKYSAMGIESFNVEFLQDREEDERSFSVIKLSPRQSQLAYSEISGRFVVDRFPEETARIMREIS